MNHISQLYRSSLALLTDLYQLTMAYGYWKSGVAVNEAVFHLAFRNNPFKSGFSVACGLHTVMELLETFCFQEEDRQYLAGLKGNDGQPIFEEAFLSYLGQMKLTCDIDAIPEGTVVFAHEPLLRVRGPLVQCQILETILLNCINFETLIATKAARVCMAARGEPVLEFGLRRAQGIDGALTASRAAYVGGCAATSNVLAGKLFGIPVRGTHAHSWIMCFDSELDAFETYAEAMPNNCLLLVDTYDTLEGVGHAVEIGRRLRDRGHELAGIRLDSGDLAGLSVQARKILDQAGFHDAVIVASNDLDEHLISRLKEQGAAIGVWGVGTKLATAYDQPALGGVYKLSAVRRPGASWSYKVKLSEEPEKVSIPGILQVRRFYSDGEPVADVIHDIVKDTSQGCLMVDLTDVAGEKRPLFGKESEELLVPVLRQGKRVYNMPGISEVRQRTQEQLGRFQDNVKRLVDPFRYPVGLEQDLYEIKAKLVSEAR